MAKPNTTEALDMNFNQNLSKNSKYISKVYLGT